MAFLFLRYSPRTAGFIRAFSSGSRRRTRQASSSRRPHHRQTTEKPNQRLKEQVNEMFTHDPSSKSTASRAFVARDGAGKELSMNEYLHFASLSPWVPCPDPVAIRALDIAKISSNDIHYELGCGDGRMNFHAIDSFYNVKKSVGIDIDPSLIERSNHRKARIHPTPGHLQFICADLIDLKNRQTLEIWNLIQKECTILTMYFVEDALLKMKGIMEEKLLGSNCKVITIGYPVNGWEPMWMESLLGLKIHMYDMSNEDHLFNRSVPFDTASLKSDEILNALSKEKLRDIQKEENDPRNPFRAIDSGVSTGNIHGEDDDDGWDFDENIQYDEHDEKV